LKASDNEYPSLLVKEGSAPSSPAAGDQRLFVDSADHLLKLKNSSGTVTAVGSGFANPMTTAGDIIYGGASGVATRLAGGTSTYVLTSNGATSAPSWQAPSGGASTIAYPSLKPGSPTDDFTAALSGWTAVSGAGTFVIGNCLGQAIDGSHLWMGYNDAQRGFIYKTASNVDQEWIVGGLTSTTRSGGFIGVALLDTSNDGVALIYHTSDNTCAIIAVAAGVYTASPSAVVLSGSPGSVIATPSKIWLRLTRTTNTWDAYYSYTGAAWDVHAGSTMSRTITVARKAVGEFSTDLGAQQIVADYVHTV
jgi:hypothetical protein